MTSWNFWPWILIKVGDPASTKTLNFRLILSTHFFSKTYSFLCWTIDHIDFDCQTCEGDVISDEVYDVLSKKVKSMWIECHSQTIGQILTDRFTKWGWHFVYKITSTPKDFGYGTVTSENEDTVDLWVLNPKFYPNGKQLRSWNLSKCVLNEIFA